MAYNQYIRLAACKRFELEVALRPTATTNKLSVILNDPNDAQRVCLKKHHPTDSAGVFDQHSQRLLPAVHGHQPIDHLRVRAKSSRDREELHRRNKATAEGSGLNEEGQIAPLA